MSHNLDVFFEKHLEKENLSFSRCFFLHLGKEMIILNLETMIGKEK